LEWDAEAAVWTATSDSIPGLAMESGSLDALMERVRTVFLGCWRRTGCRPGALIRCSIPNALNWFRRNG
jgi:hypothetical protein